MKKVIFDKQQDTVNASEFWKVSELTQLKDLTELGNWLLELNK